MGYLLVKLKNQVYFSNLPWVEPRKMRNIIVHDYSSTDVEQIYSTIHNDLPGLKEAFIKIKKELVEMRDS